MIRPMLLLTIVFLSSSACVPSAKYDRAVQTANDARAEAQRNAARNHDLEASVAKLQSSLDDATAQDAQLRAELDRLGKSSEALLAEKGSLAASLDEVRRAQILAELRTRLYRDLAVRLKKMVDAGDLRIALRDGRMVLQLPNDVLFDSGQAELRPRGQAALKQVAAVLKTIEGRDFQVAGHTDNVPIETSRFPSNWELSSARSLEVVRFMIGQGVKPAVLSLAGYGEFDPVAPNDDEKGRARNRRIEITVQPNVNEIVAVPGAP